MVRRPLMGLAAVSLPVPEPVAPHHTSVAHAAVSQPAEEWGEAGQREASLIAAVE